MIGVTVVALRGTPRVHGRSACEVDEDGLAGHGGVEVVLGSGCSGIGAAVGLTRTDRGDGALVGRGGADFVDDDGVTVGLELGYRLIDAGWAGRSGGGAG